MTASEPSSLATTPARLARLVAVPARALRKHKHAVLALVVFNFVLFFPVLFMSRVVSPNDVFYNFDPWSLMRPVDTQNSLINDPPTAYLTLISLLKSAPGAFHWNPYIASGIPGFGSSASAVLSPFILLPALLPLTWVYTAMLFLKFNLAFLFAYWWLREERLGKRGAALGALVIAGAGIYAVRWLWQLTNATAFYPLLLLFVRRAFSGRRNSITLLTLASLAYALSGFPATMAYGAYLAIAYIVFLIVRERRLPLRAAGGAVLSVALALAIAAPSLIPFAQFVRRSGYLEIRADASLNAFYPPSHWRSFVSPQRLGNSAYKNWRGDRQMPAVLNNYIESTIYVGLLTLPLLLLALLNRRTRSRWFWIAATVVILSCMFNLGGVPRLVGHVPGFKYSSLTRVALLLPVAAGYLAAAGAAWLFSITSHWRIVATTLAIVLVAGMAADLSLFAGRFYPYLTPSAARIPSTPTIAYLQAQPKPFRIAPFFNYLWPNSSELVRLEDVRSHFSSEAVYRRMLQRIDPTSFGGSSTVIQFNSLKFNFADPFVAMLGVRYFVEHKNIDIIKWTIFGNTKPGVPEHGALVLKPGMVAQRTVRVDAEPFYAIELPVSSDEIVGVHPSLHVTLLKSGVPVYGRAFTPGEIGALSKIYIPLRRYARLGESVVLRVQPLGLRASLLGSAPAPAGETSMFYGRVLTPVVFDRELPDGRLFLNLAEVPRFHAVTAVRKMSVDQLFAATDVDFEREAIVTDPAAPVPSTSAGASVTLHGYEEARQQIETKAMMPFFLASSEKLTPELRVTIDGVEQPIVGINALFAGVSVPAGTHQVEFTRRLARGWWPLCAIAAAILLLIAILESVRALRSPRLAREP